MKHITLHCNATEFETVITCTGLRGSKIFAKLNGPVFEDRQTYNWSADLNIFSSDKDLLIAVKEHLGDETPIIIHGDDLFNIQEKEEIRFSWMNIHAFLCQMADVKITSDSTVRENYEYIFGKEYPLLHRETEDNTNEHFLFMLSYNSIIEEFIEFYDCYEVYYEK